MKNIRNNLDSNLGNSKTSKNYGYCILMTIFFIVIIVVIIICLNYLVSFKNALDKYDNDISDTLFSVKDVQEKINKQLDDVDDAYASIVSELYTINTLEDTVSFISNDYLPKNEYESAKDRLDGYSDINVYDSSEIIKQINNINRLINNNDIIIDSLYLNKEDKINKTDEFTLETANETSYITCTGLETEMIASFDLFYPIGSIYISVNDEMPKHGVWQKLEINRVLWSSNTGDGSLLGATLPNVKGDAGYFGRDFSISGLFNAKFVGTVIGKKNWGTWSHRSFSLARANSIYKDGATVRPPSIAVKMYKRVN